MGAIIAMFLCYSCAGIQTRFLALFHTTKIVMPSVSVSLIDAISVNTNKFPSCWEQPGKPSGNPGPEESCIVFTDKKATDLRSDTRGLNKQVVTDSSP